MPAGVHESFVAGFLAIRPPGGVASSVTPARSGEADDGLLPPRAWPDERLARKPLVGSYILLA